MKIKTLLLVLIVAAFSGCSDDDNLAKKEELKAVLSDYYNALAKKDIQKLNELTTANFILFDEGVIYNNESSVKAVEQLKPFTATFTFDSLNIHVDKKEVSMYYFRKADFTFADSTHLPVRFLESATFHQEGDKWKLRFIHSSIRK